LIPRTILNDAHSNVPITTTNIIPNKAANSTISSKGAANKIKLARSVYLTNTSCDRP
jgi:hypothetical protein